MSPNLAVAGGMRTDTKAAAALLGFDAIVSLPVVAPRPQGVDASTAGSAVDLRTRMMLAAAAPMHGAAIADLARIPTISEYPGASADELSVFSEVFDAARVIIESNGTDEELDRAVVLLSWCDAAYRAGPAAVARGSLGRRLFDPGMGEDFAARVPDDLLADLAAMRASGRLQLGQWTADIKAGTSFSSNPRLTGSHIVVGAVPDWLIGTTLIECKAVEPITVSRLRDALLQLLGYALLDLDDDHGIRELAIWLPRRGALRTWSLDQFLGTDAETELPRLRAEFQTIFNSPSRQTALFE